MRIKRPARKKRLISLTPLIDVVFLLLVFFMLASTLKHYTGIDLAGGRSGATRNNDVKNLVIVRVKGSADIDINGKSVALAQLSGELTSLACDEKLKVAVKPMNGAKVQDVVDVIEKANIEAVREVMVIK
ncbi:MAG: biopolymer transporter ExbD [Alphaproteobacteria bacterium]